MCPPRYGFVPPTKHISLLNAPYAFADGGMVSEKMAHLPSEMLARGDPDTVIARLQPRELVVPVKYVPLVAGFLKSKGIKLPNM